MGADEKDKEKDDALYRPLGLFTEVLGLVRSNYVEPVELEAAPRRGVLGHDRGDGPVLRVRAARQDGRVLGVRGREGEEGRPRHGHRPRAALRLPGRRRGRRRQPGRGGGRQERRRHREGRRRSSRATWRSGSSRRGSRARPGGRVRLAVVREGKPRHRTLDIVRASWTPGGPVGRARRRRDRDPRSRPSRPARPRRSQEILEPLDRTQPLVLDLRSNATGLVRRGRARGGALRAGRARSASSRAAGSRRRPSAPSPASACTRAGSSSSSTAGRPAPAELFAAAVREATARAPAPAPKLVPATKKADDGGRRRRRRRSIPASRPSKDAEKEARRAPRRRAHGRHGLHGAGREARERRLAEALGREDPDARRQGALPEGPPARRPRLPRAAGRRRRAAVDPILERGLKVLGGVRGRAKAAA